MRLTQLVMPALTCLRLEQALVREALQKDAPVRIQASKARSGGP